MSWLFSQALVEEYSAVNCSDGEQSVPLSVMPTPHKFWHRDKMIDASNLSRFGLTCAVLTESRGEALLTSFQAAFRARTSAPLERELEYPALDRDSGKKCPGLFATYSRDSSTWKTVQCSLFGDSEPYSETWPRSGMTRNGYAYLQPTVVPPICETVFGLWPTPVASEANAGARTPDGKRGARLTDIVKRPELWPTPCATEARQGLQIRRDGKKGKQKSLTTAVIVRHQAKLWQTPRANDAEKRGNFDINNPRNGLAGAVKRFPTPTSSMMTINDMEQARYHSSKRPPYQECYPTPAATDWKTGYRTDTTAGMEQRAKRSKPLRDHQAPGGQLNPTWVEWLMGWVLGWTALEPLAMDKYLQWLHMHGEFYIDD